MNSLWLQAMLALREDLLVHQLTHLNQSPASGYAHAEYNAGAPPNKKPQSKLIYLSRIS